jgi:hypothetical protein
MIKLFYYNFYPFTIMKTNTLLGWVLLCSFLLLHFTARAQYPVTGAPIFGNANGVAAGHLDAPDKHIWFKVNGKMVGPQPHSKMHPYVTPGSNVDVNFNVNKTGNRYTMVSYTVHPDGKRVLYDYQSNFYNSTKPLQGSSNQQLVLVPTCKFEVYFLKGTLVDEFTVAPNATLTTSGPTGNPFGSNVIDYAYGGTGECLDCPRVINNGDCVFSRILEVIDLPATQEKEIVMSVINTIGTTNNSCGNYELLGDIILTNINPTHIKNNQPYAFRYNYQLGPVKPNYPLPNPPGNQNAFIFDQRNNAKILAYDIYQSEVIRFKVSYAEYQRLSTGASPAPEICVELTTTHPDPHQSFPPIYCADLDFVCGPPCTPPTANITGPDTLCLNNATDYTFTTTAVTGATYNWSAVNATIVSGAGTNSIQVKADKNLGAGSVSVTVTNNCGSASDTNPFFVKNCGQACIPIDSVCYQNNCHFSVTYLGDQGSALLTHAFPAFTITNISGETVQAVKFSLPNGLSATELSQLDPFSDLGWLQTSMQLVHLVASVIISHMRPLKLLVPI